MAKKKKILFPVLFMVGITVVYTLSLALVNEASLSRIEEQNALITQKAILYVLNIENDGTQSAIQNIFKEKIETVNESKDSKPYYVYRSEGAVKGYVFNYTGKGLWGSISGYAAFSQDFSTLLGLEFTSHSETPGLGGRIDEPWFKDQFRGLDLSNQPPVRMNPETGGNVDGITGATLTGTAVKNILNELILDVLKQAEEGNFNE